MFDYNKVIERDQEQKMTKGFKKNSVYFCKTVTIGGRLLYQASIRIFNIWLQKYYMVLSNGTVSKCTKDNVNVYAPLVIISI